MLLWLPEGPHATNDAPVRLLALESRNSSLYTASEPMREWGSYIVTSNHDDSTVGTRGRGLEMCEGVARYHTPHDNL